ncbi:MAG: hypothetical protein LBK25_07515, partial [Treponema sp.]|nr:hypothetical protein [Treponema sp.]
LALNIIKLPLNIIELAPDIIKLALNIIELAPDIIELALNIIELAPDIIRLVWVKARPPFAGTRRGERRGTWLGGGGRPPKGVWRQGGAPQGRLCAALRLGKDAPPSYLCGSRLPCGGAPFGC